MMTAEDAGGERSDFWIRVIVVLKFAKAIVLIALGIAAFTLYRSDIYKLVERFIGHIGIDGGRPTIVKGATSLIGLSPDRIVEIGVGSIIYALVFAVEGWGLHKRKRWAEWLTIVVTTSLIPFEIYELVQKTSATKIIALIVNIAIVIYLLVRRLRKE